MTIGEKKKQKYGIIVFLVLITCLLVSFLVKWNTKLGVLTGCEHQYIIMNDGTTYVWCTPPFGKEMIDTFLGKVQVKDGDAVAYIYSVKGDKDQTYIYKKTFFEDSCFYIKESELEKLEFTE